MNCTNVFVSRFMYLYVAKVSQFNPFSRLEGQKGFQKKEKCFPNQFLDRFNSSVTKIDNILR